MNSFRQKLKEIKKYVNKDFKRIKLESNEIILRIVDTNDDTVNLLYDLREKYSNMFATDFEMTKEKTKEWIEKYILENTERILFMIYVNEREIGCIGNGGFDEKNNSSQLDNMMKDPTFKIPGIMTIVEKVYLKWMFDCFELSKIVGYLFSDNERMMNIHKKCGWVLIDTVPVKKVIHEEGIRWEEMLDDSGLPKLNALYDSSSPVTANYPPVRRKGIQNDSNNQIAERYFNIIELTRKNLMKNFTKIEYKINM